LRTLDGLAGLLIRIRDGCVLDEQIEAAKLAANALRRGGDRSLIRHVELERAGVRPNLLGRSLAALGIARPDQHSEAVCHEILCDLKTDSLIGAGDEGDGFVLHSHLQLCIAVWPTPPSCARLEKRNGIPFVYGTVFRLSSGDFGNEQEGSRARL
jgi:hypothetical protein